MSKVRVYEVARELGITNRDLVAMFQSLGHSEVRNHMSAVEQEVVERVKRKLERKSEPEVVEEKIRGGKVVKRRAKGGGRRVAGQDAAAPAPAEPSAPMAVKPAADKPKPPAARKSKAAAVVPVPTPAESVPVAETPEPAPPVAVAEPAPEPVAAEPPPAEIPAPEVAQAPVEAAPSEAKAAPAEVAPTPVAPVAVAPAEVVAKPPAKPTPRPTPPPAEEPPRRPTSPPKTGIEVWEGRPGVPMPQRPRGGSPTARRTTYDPRANVAAGRQQYGGYGRPVPGRPMRPGFGRGRMYQRDRRRGPAEVSTKEMSDHKKVIKIEGETSLQGLANKMSLKATEVLMKLLGMGMAGVNINSTLDADTATMLAAEFGWMVEDTAIDVEEELAAATELEGEEVGEAVIRPPIVTVMGHVDHGKTTLLDTIRKADVVSGEAGGITQHIGAYRVETKKGTICFLDTPGHAAFTAMRARGASLTDIVILVVAADDNLMPQTKEAIAHAREAGVPMIVAINKIDKPGVDPDNIMRQLASEGLQPEDWGGENIFCKVSALKGTGVDHLLDMVLLQSEMLELRAFPQKRASGVVVEALLDRGRGAVARVLVKDGTLQRGDVLLAGHAYGKIRAMVDEKGRKVKEAGPSTPVEVLGLNEVPEAGDPVHAVKSVKQAETLADERRKKVSKGPAQQGGFSLKDLAERLAEAEQLELKVILKADVQGSVEALSQALVKLSTKKVKLGVVHTGVGGITETDVNLALASKAIIIGFNVRPAGKARKLAETEGIEIRLYSVIYEAIDDVRSAMEGLLPARKVEKELGKAQIRQVFRVTKVGTIAGCMVVEGLVKRNAEMRLIRDDVVLWSGKISSLKRFKDDAREVREGLECGISLEGNNDLREGDILEAYEIEEVAATLE